MDLNCRNITNKNKNNDKNLFIKNLSLEIINTLNGLDGFLNLFNKKDLTERNKELLNQAKYASFILSHQINSLNYMQEVEMQSPKINYFCLNLYEMSINSIEFFKNEYKDKNIDFNFNYDNKIPTTLYGDSLKINELLNSLLEAAYLLTNENIELKIQQVEKNESFVKINFELTVNNKLKIEKEFFENISQKRDIKKIDINFAMSKELLKQLDSKLIFEFDKDNFVKIFFNINFSLEEKTL